MKKLLFSLLLFSGIAYGQYPSVLVDLRNDNSAVELHINDLSQTQVDLGFDFPFYDNTYDKVWVTYTGVLNFQDTGVNGGTFCCSGFDLEAEMYNTEEWRNGNKAGALSQSIFGLWTDLAVAPNPNPWFKTTNNTATFGWYDIPEYYDLNNLNSFEIKLFDTGDIKFRYDEINIDSHNTTVGTAGDLSIGQYNVLKYKQNGWNKDVPMVWTFNTLTGNFEDQYGDITTLATSNSNVSDYVAIDPCAEDPKSCGIFDPTESFLGYDDGIYGNDIYDFVDPNADAFNSYQDSMSLGPVAQDFFEQKYEEDPSLFDYANDPNYGYVEEAFNDQMPIDDSMPPMDDFSNPPVNEMKEEIATELQQLEEKFNDFIEESDVSTDSFEEIQAAYEEFTPELDKEEFFSSPLDNEYFEEEITLVKDVMSKNEENLLTSEPTVKEIEDSVVGTISRVNAARRVDAVGIAMEQIATQETLLQSLATQEFLLQEIATQETLSQDMATEFSLAETAIQDVAGYETTEESILEELLDQNSGSDSGGMDFSMGDTGQTFSSGGSSFESEATLDFTFGSNPEIFVATVVSSSQTETQQEILDTSSQGTTTTDQDFGSQTDQAFSSGGSISDALTSTAPPDFSRFNVAPPSQQEQQTTQRADAQANNMSDEQLEQNLDEFASNMQDSGGFTDQSLTVFLMGRNSAFSQYSGQLQDVSFYTDRGMPTSSVQNDRNSMLRMIGTDNKHEELISLQYGR